MSSGEEKQNLESHQLVEVSQMLYHDCISALAMCLEGELKHFHRARYRLAQGCIAGVRVTIWRGQKRNCPFASNFLDLPSLLICGD